MAPPWACSGSAIATPPARMSAPARAVLIVISRNMTFLLSSSGKNSFDMNYLMNTTIYPAWMGRRIDGTGVGPAFAQPANPMIMIITGSK
jgi:hypothetical protein